MACVAEDCRAWLASLTAQQDSHQPSIDFRVLIKDPTLYTFSLYWMCHGIGGVGIGFSLPTVVYQLGYTNTTYSQLMNIVSPGYPSKRR